MASYSPAPGGPATITNQGRTLYCTRHSVAKAVANGFWNKKFTLTKSVDFEHGYILQTLINEHKVSNLSAFLPVLRNVFIYFRTPLENGHTTLMEALFVYQ